ncbi:MAG TPA: acyl-CoA dehydrogenase, partial [Polyangiales bacterium]
AALRLWLDPAQPPPPSALRALARKVGELLSQVPIEQRHSLSDLSSSLADGQLGKPASEALRALTTPLDNLFAYEPLVPGTKGPRAPKSPDAAQATKLRAALDGPHAPIRQRVRELLADPRFRFVRDVTTAEYRAQVLEWLKAVASTRLPEVAYPHGLEAGRDIGAFVAAFEALGYFDLSLLVKFGVQFGLFGGSIEGLGSERHRALLPDVASCELLGCFAMTERAHGSNVRDLQTVARYDVASREFVITTPHLGAGKEWIGNAALHARMALVFAQLSTGNEQYGVHAFLVPIRDAHGNLLPGVRCEDCGEKMGLNGVDNGRLWFDDVRVPRDALLDRFGQVSEDGSYTSPIPSAGKRFFTMLGTLVGGRIAVAGGALSASKVGLAIALDYAQLRSQFPDEEAREKLLIDYLTHQQRLLPRLAAAYAFSFAQQELVRRSQALGPDDDARGVETLAAGVKAFGTWQAVDTLQQCRESCGGQGYLSANRIDSLRVDADVFTTFEGDNTVLSQLVAKELLYDFRRQLREHPVRTVARSIADRVNAVFTDLGPLEALRSADDDALEKPEFQLELLRLRERSLLESLTRRIAVRAARGTGAQVAFEACQDHALALARAHVEHFALEAFRRATAGLPELTPLCSLYGLWRLQADAAWFLENGLLAPAKSRAIRKRINRLLAQLRDEVPLLVAAFGIPPSCLGPLADPEYLRATGLVQSEAEAAATAG